MRLNYNPPSDHPPVTPVIEFNDVSKRFRIEDLRPRSFQERFVRALRRPRATAEDLWVLRDVSFSLASGASLGVIGPNGAGKSTLLKLCARVLEPTSGTVRVAGRVSALLELGLGFHPELTGRENVFLYGSLVGIGRAAMKRRFDDIVAFSEIERFIDLPVKLYSTGMYLRLAFAVAIHVDADVLLIDEAFAVGDDRFQKRCLERIQQIQTAGVTTLLVSHSAELVRRLCGQALWIQDGRVQALGSADEIVTAYTERSADSDAALKLNMEHHRWGTREAEITGVQFLDQHGHACRHFRTGEPLVARIHYVAHRRIMRPVFGLAIYREDGIHVNGPNTVFGECDIDYIHGPGSIDYRVEMLNLFPGTYQLSVAIYDSTSQHPYDFQHRVYPFWVKPHPALREKYGVVYMPARWEHRPGK